jgi:hypothetical protein
MSPPQVLPSLCWLPTVVVPPAFAPVESCALYWMVWQPKCPSSIWFPSFLAGEPKAFPFVVRRCLPSVMGLLGVLAGGEGVGIHGGSGQRKEKRLPKIGLERHIKDGIHGRERQKKRLKNTSSGKGGHFGKSQQKLSLPRLPTFPHYSAFIPSGLVLPFCGFGDCCSRSRERAGVWMGTVGD